MKRETERLKWAIAGWLLAVACLDGVVAPAILLANSGDGADCTVDCPVCGSLTPLASWQASASSAKSAADWTVYGTFWNSPAVAPAAASRPQESDKSKEADWSVLLPEDEGKAEVTLSCSNCHGLKQVITQKKTKAGWQTSVQKMIVTYQAPVAKEDILVLVGYLAKHFGEGNPIEQLPLNVNTCSSAALERLPGISAETAKAIVECRRTGGAFTSVDDLRRVEGIDDATLKRIKPYIKAKD